MDEKQLSAFRSDIKMHLIESLVLRLHLMLPLMTSNADSVEESLRSSLGSLDELAQAAARIFSSQPELRNLSDAHRALCIDEVHEIIEEWKNQLRTLADAIQANNPGVA